MSIGITKQILVRLIEGKALTPIEDTEDAWDQEMTLVKHEKVSYQCKRMYSLFKDIYPDGRIEYHDNDRIICANINNINSCYSFGFVNKIIEGYIGKIKMPYVPLAKPIKAICEDFKSEEGKGDFDTFGILYYIDEKGNKKNVNRFFKETEKGVEEISNEEYTNRKNKSNNMEEN